MMELIRSSPKSLGAYFTPSSVADVLAQFVVRRGDESILEPSAGDGALVRASIERAALLSGDRMRPTFLACDIDPERAQGTLAALLQQEEIIVADFLEIDSIKWPKFDAAIANPPFIRNHAILHERRKTLRHRFNVEGAAGIWVHFLVHMMSFIKTGGRLASVIPASAAFTQYGKQALQRVSERFASVELKLIANRTLWVNGADERGAILLADGFMQGTSVFPEAQQVSIGSAAVPVNRARSVDAYHQIEETCTTLGELAQISIGAVTGKNSVFLLSETERCEENIEMSDVIPVAARARHLEGMLLESADLRRLARAGEKTWMLTPKEISRDRTGVRGRLSRISALERRTKVWLNKRDPWWKIDAGTDCDAIFTYMNHLGPRLVVCGPGIRCTNTLHRVIFRPGVIQNMRYSAALTLISTFGQLASELTGRVYGGGVLKFELMEARRLPVLFSGSNISDEFLRNLDKVLRAGRNDEARQIADRCLMPSVLGHGWSQEVAKMDADLKLRRATRNKGLKA